MYYYEELDLFGRYRAVTSVKPPQKITSEGRKRKIRLGPIFIPEEHQKKSLTQLAELFGTPLWVDAADFSWEVADRPPFSRYAESIAYFADEEIETFDETHSVRPGKRGCLLGISYQDGPDTHYLSRDICLARFGELGVYDLEDETIPYRNPPGS